LELIVAADLIEPGASNENRGFVDNLLLMTAVSVKRTECSVFVLSYFLADASEKRQRRWCGWNGCSCSG